MLSGQFSLLTALFPLRDPPAPHSTPLPWFSCTSAHCCAPAHSIFGPHCSVFRSDCALLTCCGDSIYQSR